MPGRHFVTVRFVVPQWPPAEHTRRHPGSRLDGVVASSEGDGDGLRLWSLVQVRGMPPPAFQELLADLRGRHGPVEVVAQDPDHQSWLLRCRLEGDGLPPLARSLADFQQRFCIPWTHVEAGQVVLRAETRSEETGREEAQRIQAYLDGHGIEGTAACTLVRGADLETWQVLCGLVEAAAGGAERIRPVWERVGRVRDLP